MDIYLIRLEGQGDFDIKAVDLETWNWIHGPSGRPAGKTCWTDPFVPRFQEERLKSNGSWPLRITSGSWKNDRAMAAVCLPEYAAVCVYGDETEADIRQLAVQRGDSVVEVFEGCIY